METWEGLEKGTVLYFADSYELKDDDGNYWSTVKKHTPAQVFSAWRENGNELRIDIPQHNWELIISKDRDDPSIFLSEYEYKKLKTTEPLVWRDIRKVLQRVEYLDNPSDKLQQVLELARKTQ